MSDAIIQPIHTAGCPKLRGPALMVATRNDLKTILGGASGHLAESNRAPLMSRLFVGDASARGGSLIGPMMGAPYAVALMETLVSWGADSFLFFGWCGAVSPGLAIGDIIVCRDALIDEGTSRHYGREIGEIAPADPTAADSLREMLRQQGCTWHEGRVWSTDAPFRETPRKVTDARDQGALAVEMETSALFTLGRYRNVSVGAVLVVSDNLSSLTWRPGFTDNRFRAARRAVCEGFAKLCRTPRNPR